MAVVDYFLKLDGVEGESQDSKHKNEIQLESFSLGLEQQGTAMHGSGLGAGKAFFKDFHVVKKVDKASPKLLLACANGDHIKSAILVCRKAGKEQQEFWKVTFSDVLVSKFSTGHEEDTVPMDHVAFNYSKIECEYKEQKQDGTLGGSIKTGYDIKQQKST